jgi:hypothetical protein
MLIKLAKWVFVVLLIPVLFLAWCHFSENPKAYFASYDDAKNSGIMEAGWVPTFIPRSSYEIRETHNIDTNIVKMSFKYNPVDKDSVKENCHLGKPIIDGEQYLCEYFGHKVTITLYADGSAELYGHGS